MQGVSQVVRHGTIRQLSVGPHIGKQRPNHVESDRSRSLTFITRTRAIPSETISKLENFLHERLVFISVPRKIWSISWALKVANQLVDSHEVKYHHYPMGFATKFSRWDYSSMMNITIKLTAYFRFASVNRNELWKCIALSPKCVRDRSSGAFCAYLKIVLS